jgi:hypothetical protein
MLGSAGLGTALEIDHHKPKPLTASMATNTAIIGLRDPPRSIIAPSNGAVIAPIIPAHLVASATAACPATGSPIIHCAKYAGKTYVTTIMKYGLRANSNKAQDRPGGDIAPPVPAI